MMLRIVVMNPKGGCGKTTLSTNLASYYSNQGKVTTLMDLDPQGSSIFWAHKRPEQAAHVQLVDAHNCPHNVTRSWAIQPPRNTDVLILDSPARPNLINLTPLLKEASAILLPVLTNEFDIHALANTTQQLQRSLPHQKNIALIFNRATKSRNLKRRAIRLTKELGLPVIATLRDTRNYVQAAASGLGICEMKGAHYLNDKSDLAQIIQWCEERQPSKAKDTFQHLNPDTIALANTA